MPIENLKKHVGSLSNTGVRVAVVFRKLPNDEKSCLIVETERLPDSYHDTIMQCLASKEAADTTEFYEVLNRRNFPDGLNCLTALHQRGFLRKEPVTNVNLMPLPGQSVPLELINATIDGKVEQYKASQNSKNQDTAQVVQSTTAVNENDPEKIMAIAKGLIVQASLLENDAAAKREEAYALVPELKPGPGRPADPEEIKEAKIQERKDKRRERDRANRAKAREEKKAAALDAKVQAKILRDAARIDQESSK